jgi:hypothetical protein
VVVDEQHLALPGELDRLGEEVEVDAGGGGVVRERQHRHPGLRPGVLPGLLHRGEELVAGAERDLGDVGPREERTPDVDRIRRRGDQRGVARLQEHPHEVGEPLFGPDGVDDLGVGVELDTEAPLVEVGDGLAELGDATALRVAVVAGVLHRLGQLVDRDLR